MGSVGLPISLYWHILSYITLSQNQGIVFFFHIIVKFLLSNSLINSIIIGKGVGFMSNYKKIIVAIDGSKEAEYAFKEAIKIAKKNDSTLLLVHVIDLRTFATINAYDQSIVERADSYAQELLETYKEEAINAGIENVSIIIEYGSPKVKISKDIAQKYEADLILCGATGLNAVERFLIGSVSEYIVRHAKCDVLVVRTNKQ